MAAKKKALSTAKRRERPGEYVGFRSPAWLKKQLEQAADLAGRSLSTEAQFRLERSFERGALLYDGLDLAYGKPIAGILLLLGSVLRATSLRQGHRSSGNLPFDEAILHPEVRQQALLAAKLVIDEFGPAAPTIEGEPHTLGEVVALGHLDSLERGKLESENLIEIASRLAPLLKEKAGPNENGEA
jgi:hypothetical protein